MAILHTYNIKEFEIKNGVTEIKDEAFLGCDSLERISIPNTVTSIGSNAFKGCYFSEFAIHANATGATKDVQIVANTVRVFGDGDSKVQLRAFNRLSSYATVIFDEGVSIIDMILFDDIRYINEIHLPSTLEEISPLAFSDAVIGKLVVHADATDATKQLSCKVNNVIITGDGDSVVENEAFKFLCLVGSASSFPV